MIYTKICAECEKLLGKAVNAIHEHEAQLHRGLYLNVTGRLTEELREKLAPEVAASFDVVQMAWTSYCQHLDQHGLLTPEGKARIPQHSR